MKLFWHSIALQWLYRVSGRVDSELRNWTTLHTHVSIVCPIYIFWLFCVQHNHFFLTVFGHLSPVFAFSFFFVLVVGKYMCTYMCWTACCCRSFLVRHHTSLLVARCSVVSLSWQVKFIQRGWCLQPLARCVCVVVRTHTCCWPTHTHTSLQVLT